MKALDLVAACTLLAASACSSAETEAPPAASQVDAAEAGVAGGGSVRSVETAAPPTAAPQGTTPLQTAEDTQPSAEAVATAAAVAAQATAARAAAARLRYCEAGEQPVARANGGASCRLRIKRDTLIGDTGVAAPPPKSPQRP